jgi:hypothetical protein
MPAQQIVKRIRAGEFLVGSVKHNDSATGKTDAQAIDDRIRD